MKHTQGKLEALQIDGNIAIWIEGDAVRILEGEWSQEKAKIVLRITALWNAAHGMTTEEAVKFLENGREMVGLLFYWGNNIPVSYPTKAIILRAKNLLKKMEGTNDQ